jgi:hypothetical protein
LQRVCDVDGGVDGGRVEKRLRRCPGVQCMAVAALIREKKKFTSRNCGRKEEGRKETGRAVTCSQRDIVSGAILETPRL